MCGIIGAYSRAGRLPEPGPFQAALDRLQRRGPDDSGLWSDEHLKLGHRRLAIVDLSAAGHQPMQSSDDRYVIVFNGEIYNHRELRPRLQPVGGWRGTSDTETLLEAYRAWGVGCLAHINGMFAFAIWDRRQRQLFVARDRLGVKPLYYSWCNEQFAFASRPIALTAMLDNRGGGIDPEGLRAYLELGYVPGQLSFYRDVRKLPPGHYALVNERGPRIVRYWDYRHIAPDQTLTQRPEAQLVDEFDQLVRNAVRSRLMSDVPLGAFLSGGVDSSLIVAAMKAVGVSRPSTFTIAFDEPAYNEGPAAARIAGHLGVEHVQETLSVNDLIRLLPLYVDEFDEPLADSSAFPTMAVARLARRHTKVVLSGDGGDEQFGGYHYYPLADRLMSLTRWPPKVRAMLGRALGMLPSHRAGLLAGALTRENPATLFNFLRSVGKDYAPLVSDDIVRSTTTSASMFEQVAAGFSQGLSSAEIAMRLDTAFTLPDEYLQKVDVATMAFSLEARCPLTDYRLVEWAMRLPVGYKIRNGQSKYLLKKVLCKYLPAEMVYRPKIGFGVPISHWLRGPLLRWAQELVYDDTLMSRLPLDKARVREVLRLQMSGARNAHARLWSVLMLLCFVTKHECRWELPEPVQKLAA